MKKKIKKQRLKLLSDISWTIGGVNAILGIWFYSAVTGALVFMWVGLAAALRLEIEDLK